jgi:bifunctional DNA primase/polymerase-like protein/SLOG family YspA-like protein
MTTGPARCGHWPTPSGGVCGTAVGVRRYLTGPRCPDHSPAAIAGRPEPAERARFRVLVTGSRTWTDPALIHTGLNELLRVHGSALVVVHGACRSGADAIAHAWARGHRVPVETHSADWAAGRSAGPARNALMVATRPDACLAFIRDQSRGATGCARLAQAAGIPTTIHTWKETTTTTGTTTGAAGLLAAALGYAKRGWPVFLLGRSKRPLANCIACTDAGSAHDPQACRCLTCHGFYAATTDADRLTAMCRAAPRGMLALRTGTAAGVVVVDIDPDHGGRLDPALMPETACVATGSGGWHLYYRHPGPAVPCSQARLGEGIDVRGDGGYVVLPPSAHPRTGRPYRWVGARPMVEMPPPLIEVCQPPVKAPAAPAPTGPTPLRAAGGISSPAALLAAHLYAVRQARPGTRRTTLYGAARGVARMVAAGAITPTHAVAALTAAGREAEQTEREIRAAITGGFHAEHVALEGIAA